MLRHHSAGDNMAENSSRPTWAFLQDSAAFSIAQEERLMSLRRHFAFVFAPVVLSALIALCFAFVARAAGWSWSPGQASNSANSVKLDDSNLTVVGAQADGDSPIVEVVNKPKTKKPSVWSRMMHPSQWFSSSKPKA